MAIDLRKSTDFYKALLDFWERLHVEQQDNNPKYKQDRAGRAILRRANDITAVTLSQPYQRFYRQLLNTGCEEHLKYESTRNRLAAAVGLLAHIEKKGNERFAKVMSQRKTGTEEPIVSELRFMRLLDSPDIDSLFSSIRRVIPIFSKKEDSAGGVDIICLTHDLLNWGDRVKKDWAYDYEWKSE